MILQSLVFVPPILGLQASISSVCFLLPTGRFVSVVG